MTTVTAYALRWHAVVLSTDERGEPILVRYLPGSFDEWLSSLPGDVPVRLDHGKQLGVFTGFDADEIGLLTVASYPKEHLRGITAYSCRAQVLDARPGTDGEGREVVDVTRAALTEAGPTPRPADPHAVIVRVGNTPYVNAPPPAAVAQGQDFLEHLESLTGVSDLDVTVGKRHAREQVEDKARMAQSLAYVLKRARRAAGVYESEFLRTLSGEANQLRLAALRTEREVLAELRELLSNDTALMRDVLASVGCPGGLAPTPILVLPGSRR